MKIDTLTSTSLDDPLYYLRNAEQVIRLCLNQHADLLLAGEVDALERLLSLDELYQLSRRSEFMYQSQARVEDSTLQSKLDPEMISGTDIFPDLLFRNSGQWQGRSFTPAIHPAGVFCCLHGSQTSVF